jgi:phosphohistidine swiveling domain-containing protein
MLFGRLETLLPPSHRHLILSLISGHGQLEEVRLVEEMWRIARSGEDPQSFIDRYGYYGLAVGEISNPSWREEPTPILETIEAYRREPDANSVGNRQRARAQKVAASIAALDLAVPAAMRRKIRKLIRKLEQFTVWREEGKACALMAIDGARAVVRRMGTLLAESGVLDEPNDAFYFTRSELQRAPWAGMKQTATWRKASRTFYEKHVIPDAFVGAPILQRLEQRDRHDYQQVGKGGHVDGVGVSPGIAEGVARIVLDPRKVPLFQNGDILVCVVTDPSWAPLFTRAGGIVTDVGGMLSHGAVIARELGVPCVVNTRGGTQRIPDGARIKIDGATGDVHILIAPVETARHVV